MGPAWLKSPHHGPNMVSSIIGPTNRCSKVSPTIMQNATKGIATHAFNTFTHIGAGRFTHSKIFHRPKAYLPSLCCRFRSSSPREPFGGDGDGEQTVHDQGAKCHHEQEG